MTKVAAVLCALTDNPEANNRVIAKTVGCSEQLVCIIRNGQYGHRPRNKIPVALKLSVEPELLEWLRSEAEKLGPGVVPSDVAVAILRDARGAETC